MRAAVISMILALVFLSTQITAQITENDLQLMDSVYQSMKGHQNYLAEINNPNHLDDIFTALNLLQITREWLINIDYVTILFLILRTMRNDEDKLYVAIAGQIALDAQIEEIDRSIANVEMYLNGTKTKGLITAGKEIKQDLQILQNKLRPINEKLIKFYSLKSESAE